MWREIEEKEGMMDLGEKFAFLFLFAVMWPIYAAVAPFARLFKE